MRVLAEQVNIQAPRADVWAALEDFGGVSKWAPFMSRSKLVGPQETGVGTRRIMHHSLGFNFEELVVEWTDGVGYTFDVYRAPYPMINVRENWNLEGQDGACTVSSEVRYQMRLGPLGRALDSLMVQFIVRREMRSGLRGLKEYVERSAVSSRALQGADS